MLTAGIVLSIMVIPFIASVMRDVFEIVPAVLKESAYALGSTTWEVVWNVVLPYTKIGSSAAQDAAFPHDPPGACPQPRATAR